jgi:hypothetical protein
LKHDTNKIHRNEWKVCSADKDASASSATSSAADTSPETAETHHDDNDHIQDDDIEFISSEPDIYDIVLANSQATEDREVFMTLFLQGVPENTPAWKRNLFMTCKCPHAVASLPILTRVSLAVYINGDGSHRRFTQ